MIKSAWLRLSHFSNLLFCDNVVKDCNISGHVGVARHRQNFRETYMPGEAENGLDYSVTLERNVPHWLQ